MKSQLLVDLLAWYAGTSYWTAGYDHERAEQFDMSWPEQDPDLHADEGWVSRPLL